MTHIVLVYVESDHSFAHQLATHIEQRGLKIWPVPDTPLPFTEQHADHTRSLDDASHILSIIPADAADFEHLRPHCEHAQTLKKPVIAIRRHPVEVPDDLRDCRVINFEGQFLLAFEELSQLLHKTHAASRPQSDETPLRVVKPGLLPIRFPAERCWREDRLRINYNLPVLLGKEELDVRIPAFFTLCTFKLEHASNKRLRGRRDNQRFYLFDPRRAQHTLTIRRRKGRVQLIYRMTRLQVYHWFPAHYRTLDREAAVLYRYLITGKLDDAVLEPVKRQARRARLVSWGTIVGVWVFLALIVALIVLL